MKMIKLILLLSLFVLLLTGQHKLFLLLFIVIYLAEQNQQIDKSITSKTNNKKQWTHSKKKRWKRHYQP